MKTAKRRSEKSARPLDASALGDPVALEGHTPSAPSVRDVPPSPLSLAKATGGGHGHSPEAPASFLTTSQGRSS